MRVQLDVTDRAALEAALESVPVGTLARVVTGGEKFVIRRVPGGWFLDGDTVVASGDVADGRPSEVSLEEK